MRLILSCLLIAGQLCFGGLAEETILESVEFDDVPFAEAMTQLATKANDRYTDRQVSVSFDLTPPDPRLKPTTFDPSTQRVTIMMDSIPLSDVVRYLSLTAGVGSEIRESREVFEGHARTKLSIVFTDVRQTALLIPPERFLDGQPGVYAGFHRRVPVEPGCRLFDLFDLIAEHSGVTTMVEDGLKEQVATVALELAKGEYSLLSLLRIAVAALERQTGKDVVLFHPACFAPADKRGSRLLGIGLRENHPEDVFRWVRPPGLPAEDAVGGAAEMEALRKSYADLGLAETLYHEPDLNAFWFVCRSPAGLRQVFIPRMVPSTPSVTYRAKVSGDGTVTVGPADGK